MSLLWKQSIPPSLACSSSFHPSQMAVSGPRLDKTLDWTSSVPLSFFFWVITPFSLSQTPRAMGKLNHGIQDLLDPKASSSNMPRHACLGPSSRVSSAPLLAPSQVSVRNYPFWERPFLITLFKVVSSLPLCYVTLLCYPPMTINIWIHFVVFLLILWYPPHQSKHPWYT